MQDGRHTHVIPTTTSKLNSKLDTWDVFNPDSTFTLHHTGGRDWVLVLRHPDHPVGAHADVDLVHVEHYDDGVSDYGGLVEDEDRSWILYFGKDGRPVNIWLRRDTSGAVIGEPVTFSGAQVDSVPGWDLRALRESVGKVTDATHVQGVPIAVAEAAQTARTATIRRRSDGWDQFSFNDDDGRQVASFVVDQSCTTEVWDRAHGPEDGMPWWFTEVWTALAEKRPINFQGQPIPKWLEDFLNSPMAATFEVGKTFGNAPVDRAALVVELCRQAEHQAGDDPEVTWMRAFKNLAEALDGTMWLAAQ